MKRLILLIVAAAALAGCTTAPLGTPLYWDNPRNMRNMSAEELERALSGI